MPKRTTRQERSLITESLKGLGVAIVTNVIVCAIVAAMIAGEKIDESTIGYGAAAAIALGAMIGAITASRRAKEKRLIVCLIVGAGLYLVLLCAGMLFFDGQFHSLGVTALLTIGCSCGAGLLGLSGKKHTAHGKIRRKTRQFVHIA